MKKIFAFSLLFFCCASAFSQSVAINNSGLPADPSAMLDVYSTSKGILIPRMRGSDRLLITSPADGLLVYDIDTKSVWYYNNSAWKEIPNTTYNLTPGGPASGDLYGTYPAPNVGKIQNLDVAFGVPFDRQVMKWDALNNRWQGLNDSLFLPYNVTSGSSSRLFAVTNANTTGGSSAIFGRSGTIASSFIPGPSVGVWGDNSAGFGVYGASTSGIGVNGASFSNHGLAGLSFGAASAGVYGNGNGTGVFGETSGGVGIKGFSSFGKAAVFENNNTGNTDTLMKLVHSGTGKGITLLLNNTSNSSEALMINNAGTGQMINLYNSNTGNNAHLLFANQTGTGTGIYMSIANTLNTHPGILVEHSGTGSGIESYGFKGKAGLFQVSSATNANTALDISTLGTGNAATVAIINAANNNTALSATTNGNGSAAGFTITKTTNNNPVVTVSNAGVGRGLESILTNSSNNNAAVYASSPGLYGVYSLAKTTAVYGQATGLSGGIAVFGQAGLNNFDGIGVKGSSYSSLQDRGAVTGENNGSGVGVYATSSGANGIGIYGKVTATDATAVFAESENGDAIKASTNSTNQFDYAIVGNNYGTGSGIAGLAGSNGNGVYGGTGSFLTTSRAALFETANSSITVETVKMNNIGLGSTLYLNASNASNAGTMVRVKKSGTGDYIVFEDGAGVNKIRFDNTGKGFFNGGTQTGGADIAEAFDVTGNRNEYEPGDVLVISVAKDRTVEKSAEAYSTLVAGVYATKPGVLMSEEHIDADLGDKVPMGVVGVIPVKVCSCDGEIKRGDILVTSTLPGVAMKGDINKVKPGQIIGKALENYSSAGIGKIKALVNAR